MPAKKVTSVEMPPKVTDDELFATEVEFVRAAVNDHADALDRLEQAVMNFATPALGAEFTKLSNGKASFLLSPEVIAKQVAGLLRRRPLIERVNIVSDPVAPLPALPAAVALPTGLTAPRAADFTITARGVAAAGAPVVAEWTRGGIGGNVILVSGEGLLASTAVVYAHGKLYQAQVRNTSARQMQVQLPKNLGQFDVFVLWPKNAQGYGEPVLINCAEAWWAEDKVVAGELFSIFGDYLAQGDVTGTNNAYVGIKSLIDQKVYEAEVVEVKLDYLTVRAPAGLAIGGADCYVHNRHGGLYGVSKPIRVNCVARQDHILYKTFPNVVNVNLSTAAVNTNGRLMQDSFNGSNGLKSLRLPAGVFTVCDAAFLGDLNNGGGEILGAPLDSAGNPTTIFIMPADFVQGKWDFGFMGSTQTVDNIRIKNIEFRNPDGKLFAPGNSIEQVPLMFKKATNTAILNVNILAPKNVPLNMERGIEYVYIRKCKLQGGGSTVMQGRQVLIDDNIYEGASRADSLFNSSGVIEAACRRNVFGDKTPGSLDELETLKGRFYKVGLNYGSTYHVCVSYNIGRDVGPLETLLDQNEGEMILAEGAWQVYAGAPTATTANTITFNATFTNDYGGYDEFPKLKNNLNVVPGKHMLRIIDGPGTEQVFHILSHNGRTLTLDRPFRVRPTAASSVQIGLFHDRFSVEGNDFSGRDGVASRAAYNVQAGFNSYGGGSRCNVKRNRFTKLRAGVRFDGTYEVGAYQGERMIMPAMAMNIQGNLFDGCRRHVFFVAAQDDRNPPNYYTFPAAAIIGCRFADNVFKNAIDLDVEIEAARSEQHSMLNNGASIQHVSFDGEFGVPTQPIRNYWRYYEGLPPVAVTPSTLSNFLIAPAASDEVGIAPVSEVTNELGPVEPLPSDAAAPLGILSFSQVGNSVLGYLDSLRRFVPLARTYTPSVGGTPTPTPAGNTYYDAHYVAQVAGAQPAIVKPDAVLFFNVSVDGEALVRGLDYTDDGQGTLTIDARYPVKVDSDVQYSWLTSALQAGPVTGYTDAEIDAFLASKPSRQELTDMLATVYTKAQADNRYGQLAIENTWQRDQLYDGDAIFSSSYLPLRVRISAFGVYVSNKGPIAVTIGTNAIQWTDGSVSARLALAGGKLVFSGAEVEAPDPTTPQGLATAAYVDRKISAALGAGTGGGTVQPVADPSLSFPYNALAGNNATTSWDVAGKRHAAVYVELNVNTTLALANATDGFVGTLLVVNATQNPLSLALPAGSFGPKNYQNSLAAGERRMLTATYAAGTWYFNSAVYYPQ